MPKPKKTTSAASPLPSGHPPVTAPKVGVLLVNLGTPDGTDYWSMRRYLKEFLSDRRVIDLNPILWGFLLNVIILTKRPFTSGKAYATIWNKTLNESPLRTITRAQTEALRARLSKLRPDLICAWAMRYGTPSLAQGLEELRAQGCQKILLFALYPQYSAPTTATVHDKAFDHLKTLNWQPALRTVPSFHDDPVYIQALAKQLKTHLQKLPWQPDLIVTSFHGVPKRYLLEGDPYHCFCAKTSRLLREAMNIPEERWLLSFQSRFGTEEWLKPYTDEEVVARVKAGAKKIVVLAPGFMADCLETLEELDERLREDARHAGAEEFSYLPCLNASPAGIDVLEAVVRREVQGW